MLTNYACWLDIIELELFWTSDHHWTLNCPRKLDYPCMLDCPRTLLLPWTLNYFQHQSAYGDYWITLWFEIRLEHQKHARRLDYNWTVDYLSTLQHPYTLFESLESDYGQFKIEISNGVPCCCGYIYHPVFKQTSENRSSPTCQVWLVQDSNSASTLYWELTLWNWEYCM